MTKSEVEAGGKSTASNSRAVEADRLREPPLFLFDLLDSFGICASGRVVGIEAAQANSRFEEWERAKSVDGVPKSGKSQSE